MVDLCALNLDGIEWRARPIRLGAMTTLQTLVSDSAARVFANGMLAEAARLCTTRNIRNVATIGGTIVSGGAACDLLVALLSLDASVTVRTTQSREVPLDELLRAPRDFLESGIITDVSLPATAAPSGASLVRVARTPMDAATINAAASITTDGAACTSVWIAVGGISAHPTRVHFIESDLEGQAWNEADMARTVQQWAASIAPPDDFRASIQYRREMAAVVVRRALARAWARAQGAS